MTNPTIKFKRSRHAGNRLMTYEETIVAEVPGEYSFSDPVVVDGAGGTIGVDVVSGLAKVQVTSASEEAIVLGEAIWFDWGRGGVSQNSQDSLLSDSAIVAFRVASDGEARFQASFRMKG